LPRGAQSGAKRERKNWKYAVQNPFPRSVGPPGGGEVHGKREEKERKVQGGKRNGLQQDLSLERKDPAGVGRRKEGDRKSGRQVSFFPKTLEQKARRYRGRGESRRSGGKRATNFSIPVDRKLAKMDPDKARRKGS